jgi:C-terminal processing protease CtpA/Prc
VSNLNVTNNVDERETSPYRAPHSIIVRPKLSSQSLGFELDELKLEQNGIYVVKNVDNGSPSATAGLKEGDKITKINGKSTKDMSYDEFCDEIEVAQQMHKKHNMIHLMVMRKSQKTRENNLISSTSDTTLSTKPTTTLSSSSSLISDNNLVSVVKVTSQKDLIGKKNG